MGGGLRWTGGWMWAIAGALSLAPGVALAQPKPPVRLTVSTAGAEANGFSFFLGMSPTGRHVLFGSVARNLVADDTNLASDLFVRDRDTDNDGIFDEPGAVATVRVSVGTNGEQDVTGVSAGSISADGRFVVFEATGALVPGDTNGVSDVFMRDRDVDGDGIFDESGAVSTTRVSTGTGGAQGSVLSDNVVITPDARFVLFRSGSPEFSPLPTNGVRQVYRKDTVSGVLSIVGSLPSGIPGDRDSQARSLSHDGRIVLFSTASANFGSSDAPQEYLAVRDLSANTIVVLPVYPNVTGASGSIVVAPLLASFSAPSPGVSPDGASVYFSLDTVAVLGSFFGTSGQMYEYVVATGAIRRLTSGRGRSFAGDGRFVLIEGSNGNFGSCIQMSTGLEIYDRATDTRRAVLAGRYYWASASESLDRVIFGRTIPEDCPIGTSLQGIVAELYDRRFDSRVVLPADVRAGVLNATGSEVVFTTIESTILPPGADTNVADDIFAVDLESRLDQDTDGLDDRWEAATGLLYTSGNGTGANGPGGDPDGDGLTNLQELQAGSHPRGAATRLLAEGAENSFFHTRLALANPGSTAATTVVRFLSDGGGSATQHITLPAQSRRTIDLGQLGGLAPGSYSFIVESDATIAVDRTTRWDATGYGAHAERGVPAASTTWFLAEGSTTGSFSLFYLLQNPNSASATATVRYLRPEGAPIEKTYVLPPNSRTTIAVNGEAPELASTDVSAAITADRPILVERAMYLTRNGQAFAAGSDSAGIPAASTSWFLAEGATGAFFDMFILIANPSSTAAQVEARYLLPSGQVLTKTYTVGANSRRTIYVDGEDFPGLGAALANIDLSTTLTSLNSVPIVVERTMWFPGPDIAPAFWTESHNSPGSTSTAVRWVLADGEAGGSANTRTYVLVANTAATDGYVRMTALLEHRAPRSLGFNIRANSRFTVDIGQALQLSGERFAVIVESTPEGSLPVVPLVVERAMYWDAGGVVWAAGTNVLGTPIP